MSQIDNWNGIYSMLYQDEELKDLMLIPEADYNNPAAFRDKYFINSQKTDKVLAVDVDCRVIFYKSAMVETENARVKKQAVVFEIFTKNHCQYGVGSNAFTRRDVAVAERLRELFGYETLRNLSFRPLDQSDLAPGADGYNRYMASFEYKLVF